MMPASKVVPPDIVERMRQESPKITEKSLQACFGISYNTWRRVMEMQPIRSSIAERLIHRVRLISEMTL